MLVSYPGPAAGNRGGPRNPTLLVRGRILAAMRGRLLILLMALAVPAGAAPLADAGERPYRPDAHIKLCGLSTGCTINPLPHPWLGRNVYNQTGRRQTISVRMEDGEGVRFWIRLENDGTEPDTLVVQGCQGNRRFVVNKVLLGKQKRPHAGTTEVTRQFKRGTLSFDFGPASKDQQRIFTLNMIAPTTAEGVSYRCVIDVHSQNDPERIDTVVTRMTTY
jgi:hypothetical protein